MNFAGASHGYFSNSASQTYHCTCNSGYQFRNSIDSTDSICEATPAPTSVPAHAPTAVPKKMMLHNASAGALNSHCKSERTKLLLQCSGDASINSNVNTVPANTWRYCQCRNGGDIGGVAVEPVGASVAIGLLRRTCML